MGASMRVLCAAARRAAFTEPLVFIVKAWDARRRIDAHHSIGVAGVVLTRWCGLAIVGVVNVMRWVSRSRVALNFSPVV